MATVSKRPAPRPVMPPRPTPVDTGVELWRNVTAGVVVISRVGEYGRRLYESVTGGRVFQLTPQERRNMQMSAATEDLDMFTNGSLAPVSLVNGEPDNEPLLMNPNLLDDDDIPKLLRMKGESFADAIAAINQMAPINRLLEIARNPNFDVTVSQYEVIKRRERALKIEKSGLIEPEGPDTGIDEPRPVTPK